MALSPLTVGSVSMFCILFYCTGLPTLQPCHPPVLRVLQMAGGGETKSVANGEFLQSTRSVGSGRQNSLMCVCKRTKRLKRASTLDAELFRTSEIPAFS